LARSAAQVRASELCNGCTGATVIDRVRIPSLCRHHTAMASPRLGHATSRVAVPPPVIAITIIAIATATTTTTKTPCSNGRSPWDSDISLPEVPEA